MSFIGIMNYYSRFILKFASVCASPGKKQCIVSPLLGTIPSVYYAFEQLQQMLANKAWLVNLNPVKPISLANWCLTVLSCKLPYCSEEPIVFASKMISKVTRDATRKFRKNRYRLHMVSELISVFQWSILHNSNQPQTTEIANKNDRIATQIAPW